MLMSLSGFIGTCCRVTLLMWIYLFFMFLFLAAYLGLIIFAFAVTSKGQGYAIPGTAFVEYRLLNYAGWLQDRVNDASSRSKIRSRVCDAGVCRKLSMKMLYEMNSGFYHRCLNSIQLETTGRPDESLHIDYILNEKAASNDTHSNDNFRRKGQFSLQKGRLRTCASFHAGHSASLELDPLQNGDEQLDLIVIGCGPAGLSLAAESAKLGLTVGYWT